MSDHDDLGNLRERAADLTAELAEELADETGLDVSELAGLSAQDLRAVRLQVMEQEQAEARVEAANVRDLAEEIAASQQGMTAEQMHAQREYDTAITKARNGNWSDYLRLKYERGDVDRSAEQSDNARHQVKPWWPERKEGT